MAKLVKLMIVVIFLGSFSARGQEVFTDAAALQYCQLNPNTYIALLYPCVPWDIARVKNIFNKYGILQYEKRIILTNNGPLNILRVAYDKHHWIGGFHDDFKKLKKGRQKRFPNFEYDKSYEVIALLFECANLEKVLRCKKEVRRIFDRHAHTIHINDTHEETITMAQLVFHDTSIDFSNSRSHIQFKKFDKLLAKYKNFLVQHGAWLENFCVIGDAVKAVRGQKECSDLFFICQENDDFIERACSKGSIRSLNALEPYCDIKERDEIIFNPSKHFYYKNVKFAIQ